MAKIQRAFIRFFLSPRGMAVDRFLVRVSGRSPLNFLMASREGFTPQPMLILASVGCRSGQRREAVLPYFTFADTFVVVGSKGGAPDDPAWVSNLRHNPEAEITLQRQRRAVSGYVAQGVERAELWATITAIMAVYERYQARTEREIPVVVFEARG